MKNYNRTSNRYINPVKAYSVKRSSLLFEDSILPCGKYEGKKVIDIINSDLDYILWAKNEKVFLFSVSALMIIKKIVIDLRPKITNKNKLRNWIDRNTTNTKVVILKRELKGLRRGAERKPVYVYDKNKIKILSFESVTQAAKELNIKAQVICCYKKSKSLYKGLYYFSSNEFESFMLV